MWWSWRKWRVHSNRALIQATREVSPTPPTAPKTGLLPSSTSSPQYVPCWCWPRSPSSSSSACLSRDGVCRPKCEMAKAFYPLSARHPQVTWLPMRLQLSMASPRLSLPTTTTMAQHQSLVLPIQLLGCQRMWRIAAHFIVWSWQGRTNQLTLLTPLPPHRNPVAALKGTVAGIPTKCLHMELKT